jgi:hypothetical protein
MNPNAANGERVFNPFTDEAREACKPTRGLRSCAFGKRTEPFDVSD